MGNFFLLVRQQLINSQYFDSPQLWKGPFSPYMVGNSKSEHSILLTINNFETNKALLVAAWVDNFWLSEYTLQSSDTCTF